MLARIPSPSSRRLAVRVTAAAERQLRTGHPWLFEGSITELSHDGRPGDLAVIFDRKRRFLAIGLYDPLSPIRVKILHHGRPETIDADWFAKRLAAAAARRAPLAATATSGYRLVYGEGDGLPGLIVDRYDETLVLKIYSTAWFPHLKAVLAGLEEAQPAGRWVLRLSRAVARAGEWGFGLQDGEILRGERPAGPVEFQENGLRLAADVISGHKTGFFFDHRDNRQRVRELAAGRRTLDVFAYTGGFSLYAAAGGAPQVTSLDISEPALVMARANLARNGDLPLVQAAEHEILVEDAFTGLERLGRAGRRFELIVVDPPSFAKRADEVEGALRAYRRLTEQALPLLAADGVLVMASCSSRIGAETFFALVEETAAAAGRPLAVLARTGHPLDHPVPDSFPEGEYLKCLFARPAAGISSV